MPLPADVRSVSAAVSQELLHKFVFSAAAAEAPIEKPLDGAAVAGEECRTQLATVSSEWEA